MPLNKFPFVRERTRRAGTYKGLGTSVKWQSEKMLRPHISRRAVRALRGRVARLRVLWGTVAVVLRPTRLRFNFQHQTLNGNNANSFVVRGKGSLPPHTSGCAFDISRKNLTSDEQNFLMRKLSELEREHRLDSLREGSANACFHSFIYPDGVESPTLNTTIAEITQSSDLAASFPFVGYFNQF